MSFTKRSKRSTAQKHQQNEEIQPLSGRTRLVWWRLDRLLAAPFRLMRAGPRSEVTMSSVSGLRSHIRQVCGAAHLAIRHPPQWESIEALEIDWNIDTNNRKRYLWIQRVYVALLSVVLLLIVLGMLSLHATSVIVLISGFVVSLATCLVLLLVISISLWRIDVLRSRRAQHYVSWLCKR